MCATKERERKKIEDSPYAKYFIYFSYIKYLSIYVLHLYCNIFSVFLCVYAILPHRVVAQMTKIFFSCSKKRRRRKSTKWHDTRWGIMIVSFLWSSWISNDSIVSVRKNAWMRMRWALVAASFFIFFLSWRNTHTNKTQTHKTLMQWSIFSSLSLPRCKEVLRRKREAHEEEGDAAQRIRHRPPNKMSLCAAAGANPLDL